MGGAPYKSAKQGGGRSFECLLHLTMKECPCHVNYSDSVSPKQIVWGHQLTLIYMTTPSSNNSRCWIVAAPKCAVKKLVAVVSDWRHTVLLKPFKQSFTLTVCVHNSNKCNLLVSWYINKLGLSFGWMCLYTECFFGTLQNAVRHDLCEGTSLSTYTTSRHKHQICWYWYVVTSSCEMENSVKLTVWINNKWSAAMLSCPLHRA